MKMTREQVAELLLRMNDDCSNVEVRFSTGNWGIFSSRSVPHILKNIVNGDIYRIKDNSVKEVTKELRGKWCKDKKDSDKTEYQITAIDYGQNIIYVGNDWYNIEQFNEHWQLVED